ncbi:MAG: hypothetical protein R3C14_49115 [Caldilineaceae bacterium]
MFIDRRVFRLKPGHMPEVLALVKANHNQTLQHHSNFKARYMVGLVAGFDMLVFESEWNNLAEWEQFWPAWAAHPESGLFLQRWAELLDDGGDHQLWRVVE